MVDTGEAQVVQAQVVLCCKLRPQEEGKKVPEGCKAERESDSNKVQYIFTYTMYVYLHTKNIYIAYTVNIHTYIYDIYIYILSQKAKWSGGGPRITAAPDVC